MIWGGPLCEQVLRVHSPALRGWQMFSGQGLGVLQARFFVVREGGAYEPLDRYALSARGAPLPPRADRRIKDEEAAHKIARKLCPLLGPDADVRMELQSSTRFGWKTLTDGTANECTRPKQSAPRGAAR
ncbi:MAG: hypothetical protein Q8P18_14360 [Pseudomonadota bacterium]|nr:hypothetical protein [Pseudomonadota bacterium]